MEAVACFGVPRDKKLLGVTSLARSVVVILSQACGLHCKCEIAKVPASCLTED